MNHGFEIQQRFGKRGEIVVRHWLQSRGFVVVPVDGKSDEHPFSGKRIVTPSGSGYSPADMLRFDRHGERRWCEVKTKSVCTMSKRFLQWETGCDYDKFEGYRIGAEQTHTRCGMFFLQMRAETVDAQGKPALCPTGLFQCSTQALHATRGSAKHVSDVTGVIYWNIDVFDFVASIDRLYEIEGCAPHLDAIYAAIGKDRTHPPLPLHEQVINAVLQPPQLRLSL